MCIHVYNVASIIHVCVCVCVCVCACTMSVRCVCVHYSTTDIPGDLCTDLMDRVAVASNGVVGTVADVLLQRVSCCQPLGSRTHPLYLDLLFQFDGAAGEKLCLACSTAASNQVSGMHSLSILSCGRMQRIYTMFMYSSVCVSVREPWLYRAEHCVLVHTVCTLPVV